MMNSNLSKHLGYYVPLLAMLLFAIFLIPRLSYARQLQMTLVIATAIFYVVWGIVHHIIHHDITAKIVIEYVLIGSLGMTIILFLIKGGLLQ